MSSLIKSLFRLMVVTFIFAMLMPVTTAWADPNCAKHPEHPKCTGGGVGGVTYTAELSLGGFVFNPGPSVEVTPNAKENKLRSQTDLVMQRSDGDGTTWDVVFAACQLLTPPINLFTVFNDNWAINKDGGVRVMFSDILLQGAKVRVQLIGTEFDFLNDPFLPELGNTSEFILSQFAITGRSLPGEQGPSMSCSPRGQQINPLPVFSKLTITASAP